MLEHHDKLLSLALRCTDSKTALMFLSTFILVVQNLDSPVAFLTQFGPMSAASKELFDYLCKLQSEGILKDVIVYIFENADIR